MLTGFDEQVARGFGCLVTQLVVEKLPAQHHCAGTITVNNGFAVMIIAVRPLAGFNLA